MFIFLSIIVRFFLFQKFNPKKCILCLLLLCSFLSGILRMSQLQNKIIENHVFHEKESVRVIGKIDQVSENAFGYTLKIKDATIVLLNDTLIENDAQILNNRTVFIDTKQDNLCEGFRISVVGTIREMLEGSNPGQFNQRAYYEQRGIDFYIKGKELNIITAEADVLKSTLSKLKYKLKSTLMKVLPMEQAGVMAAMLLGEKSELNLDLKKLYQDNGIAHILAISGLHITFLGTCIFKFLQRLRCPIYIACVCSMIFVFLYGILTGFEVATNRAVVMLLISFLGKILGRTYDGISACFLAMLFLLFQNPMTLFSTGFLLSFGAIFGVFFLAPLISKAVLWRNKPKGLRGSFYETIVVSVSIQLMTIPILLTSFYQIPIYSVVLNLFVLPLMSLLLILGMLAGFIGSIFLPVGIFFRGGIYFILKFYEMLCNLVTQLPGHLLTLGTPSRLEVILYYVLLFGLLISYLYLRGKTENYFLHRHRRPITFILCTIPMLLICFNRPNVPFVMTALDVGQGGCNVIITEKSKIYLFDCGSADVSNVFQNRVYPYLKYNGYAKLDAILLSHFDQDHVSGVEELLQMEKSEGKSICDTFIVPATVTGNEDVYQLLLTYGKRVILVKQGDIFYEKETKFTVLNPSPEYTEGADNDSSLVVELCFGDLQLLLTGDIDAKTEKRMISSGLLKDIDVMTAPHHGSRYSNSQEFLEKCRPKLVIFSYGKGNIYGHPHEEAINRYEKIEALLQTTEKQGAITIKTDGKRILLEAYNENTIQ